MSDVQYAAEIETSFRDLLATTSGHEAFSAYQDLEAVCSEVMGANPDLIDAIGYSHPNHDRARQAAKVARDFVLPESDRPDGWQDDECNKFVVRGNGYTAIADDHGLSAVFSVIQHGDDFLNPDPVGRDYASFRLAEKLKGIDRPPYPLMSVVKAGRIAAYAHLATEMKTASFESWHHIFGGGKLPSLGQVALFDEQAPYVGVTGGQFMPFVERKLLEVEPIQLNVRHAMSEDLPESWVLSGLADHIIAIMTARKMSGREAMTELPLWAVASSGIRLLGTGYDLN